MLVIKPYGRSAVERDNGASGRLRRAIRRNADPHASESVADFAKTHPELVIAQWVSVIDRIATKPRRNRKPTSEQRQLREALGEASWKILAREFCPPERMEELERLWWRKIHPYGEGTDNGGRQSGKAPKPRGRWSRGRWFAAFAGEITPDSVDADAVARRIHEHLFVAERRQGGESGEKRAGLIAARAESIAANAPRCAPSDAATAQWTPDDEKRYVQAGDIAGKIADKANEANKASKASKAKKQERRMFLRDAAPLLHEHFAKLFRDEDGVPGVTQARAREPGLFALHGAVKDAYASLLKGRRIKDPAGALPQDMTALMHLVAARRDNRELAGLVRLGKAIHYSAMPSGEAADAPADVIDKWPLSVSVKKSRYWTSDGQSEIKRNEAFVRVWRGVLALAARTAKDWADPKGRIALDILGGSERAEVTGKGFDADAYRRKALLLFGDRACLFTKEDEGFEKSVLSLALKGLATLRNSSFHFKGRGGFARALRAVGKCGAREARDAARQLWRRDEKGLAGRLRDEMRGAHFDRYLTCEQCDSVFKAVWAPPADRPPLPRFRRVLSRAENAWRERKNARKKGKWVLHLPCFRRVLSRAENAWRERKNARKKGKWVLHLPSPGNRSELEDPARLCRYTALKLLYKRAFPAWLARQPACEVNRWLDRADDRATAAAKRLNDLNARSRAAGIPRLSDDETIEKFLDRLAAATATEFRVQRGYDPDPEKARAQSKYLDDIRCDTVAQAFECYLETEGFPWLLDEIDAPSKEPCCDLDKLKPPVAETPEADDWQTALYFLVHLAPVEEISKLRHQLRKMAVLEPDPAPEVAAAGRVFDLYLDMHAAKFTGGQRVAGARALEKLFENAEVFARVCPEQLKDEIDGYVPWRGLREILRFGGLSPLMPIFEHHPIRAKDVECVKKAEAGDGGESSIAAAQKRRDDLYARWVEEKEKFPDDALKAYRKALDKISRHRRLAAHVRLRNHARLHRLMMQVLARLADYAWLWERDLYFVTLALILQEKRTPGEIFDARGLKFLKNGRIVEALRSIREGAAILKRLETWFGVGEGFLDSQMGTVGIRNRSMHFNVLHSINLTEEVNGTRRLMAYDRKLKNAVSKSVIELLARENLKLAWEMTDHRLWGAKVASRTAIHLRDKEIEESLHGDQFVAMVAALFGGAPAARKAVARDGGRGKGQANPAGARAPRKKRGKRSRLWAQVLMNPP